MDNTKVGLFVQALTVNGIPQPEIDIAIGLTPSAADYVELNST